MCTYCTQVCVQCVDQRDQRVEKVFQRTVCCTYMYIHAMYVLWIQVSGRPAKTRIYRPLYRSKHFANDWPREVPKHEKTCTPPHETVFSLFDQNIAHRALLRRLHPVFEIRTGLGKKRVFLLKKMKKFRPMRDEIQKRAFFRRCQKVSFLALFVPSAHFWPKNRVFGQILGFGQIQVCSHNRWLRFWICLAFHLPGICWLVLAVGSLRPTNLGR